MPSLVGQTPWWWRDAIVLTQLQVVFSLLAALFAAAALWLAWRIATRQFAMMADQARIASIQDQIMREQLTFKSSVEVAWRATDIPRCFELFVRNAADFTVHSLEWSLTYTEFQLPSTRLLSRFILPAPRPRVRVFRAKPSYGKETGEPVPTGAEIRPFEDVDKTVQKILSSHSYMYRHSVVTEIIPRAELTLAYMDIASGNYLVDSPTRLAWNLEAKYRHFSRQESGSLSIGEKTRRLTLTETQS